MGSPSFQKRLQDVVRRGCLTTADLALCFSRPYHTVREWVVNGKEPWTPWRGEAYLCLEALERLLAKEQLPLPMSFRRDERSLKLKERFDDQRRRLPQTRTA